MQNFEFFSPTKIIFGEGAQAEVSQALKEFGGSKVLLHYGSNSAIKSGLIDEVRQNLESHNIPYVELAGVLPNPRLSLVYEGINLCKEHGIDFILAVGGGSVIDSAKAIAVGCADRESDVWDYFLRKKEVSRALPIGCILTIASAGSESSQSCVIRNENEPTKRGITTDYIRPKFAVLSPRLTFGLSKFQVACGVADITMHTLDRYFTDAKDTDITDRISEGLLSSVMKHGQLSVENPENYAARANIMWAGALSHNTLTGLGKPFDFSVHAIERGISGGFDTTHAAGLIVVWPHWARYVYQENVMRFCQYATRVHKLDMDFEKPEFTALQGIQKTADFFTSLGLPSTLTELIGHTPTDSDLETIADFATNKGTLEIGTFKKLNKQQIIEILKNAI